MSETGRAAREPLRVGLLVDSLRAPAWVARIVGELQAGEYAEIVAVLVRRAPWPAQARSAVDGALFGAFRRLDRLMSHRANDPLRRVDISGEVQGAEMLQLAPGGPSGCGWPDAAEAARMRALRLDVLLAFVAVGEAGGLADVARHGVWHYRHGTGCGAAGLWREMHEGKAVTSVELRMAGADCAGERVLHRSVGNVVPWSYARNAYHHYWKGGKIVLRRLQALAEQGDAALERLAEAKGDVTRDCARPPGNGEMLRFLPRYASRLAREARFRRNGSRQWFLAMNRGARLAEGAAGERAQMRIQRAPAGHYWADPFPVVVAGQMWVFFEEYSYKAKKGVIACAPVAADGTPGAARTALARDYHLSYPCVFEAGGALYMVPETWATERVTLWRCRRFPDDWVLERTLLEGLRMVDPTVYQQDGKLWLFGAESAADEHPHDELHLYRAEALDGEWRPHPANPVVSDCRRARPAGRLFRHDGQLLRPAQDCSGRYGSGIVLNRVEVLNEREYAETPVGRIDGSWLAGNRGIHTVNTAGGLEFLDGCL